MNPVCITCIVPLSRGTQYLDVHDVGPSSDTTNLLAGCSNNGTIYYHTYDPGCVYAGINS